MIQLSDFVSETLREIVERVVEAQKAVKDDDAIVSPYRFGAPKREGRPIQDVEFDVEVTSFEGEASKGGVGVFVAGIGAGGKHEDESRRSSAGRITFVVPLMLPTHKPEPS